MSTKLRLIVGILVNTVKHLKYFILVSSITSYSPFAVSENIAPNLTGISAKTGNFVTPDKDTHYTLLTYSSLRPYTLLRNKPAHDMLKINYELGIGYAGGEHRGRMISANMLAHRYMTAASKGIRPFVEAGIGFIYTEFRIQGQGLYLNFNPQVGIGFELYSDKNIRHFVSLRFSHISNGGLDKDNEGINALVLSFGRDLSF